MLMFYRYFRKALRIFEWIWMLGHTVHSDDWNLLLHWVCPWHLLCKTCPLKGLLQCCVSGCRQGPYKRYLLAILPRQGSILLRSIGDTISTHNHISADCLGRTKSDLQIVIQSSDRVSDITAEIEFLTARTLKIENCWFASDYWLSKSL